jgi:putative ABC transport system permease protein
VTLPPLVPRFRFPQARLADMIGLSLEALSRHRLRTVLGITGIVIGVGAVTAMLSVGEGARREVIRQVELLGLNNVVLRPRHVESSNGVSPVKVPILSFDDVDRLRRLVPFAAAWSPLVERYGNLSGPARAGSGSVLGVWSDYQKIMGLRPAQGRLLTIWDIDQDKRTCVLGFSLSRTLFGEANPIGRLIRIEGMPFSVVGVLKLRESPGTSGGTLSPRDLNTAVLIPARRGSLLGQASFVNELWMQVPDEISVADAAAVAGRALQQLHGGQRDFEALAPRDLLQQRLNAQRTFDIVLGSVAVLSLLVGGIGIMNMMLASVLERTSEIGLRRSVGATRQWITHQFLLESVLMTVAGGIFGVVVGSLTAAGVTHYAGWPTHVSVWAVGASLVISGGVGLFFGTYPALRAARLEPVDAVRYE